MYLFIFEFDSNFEHHLLFLFVLLFKAEMIDTHLWCYLIGTYISDK